ncbi:MAG: NERD domain-containing protein [Chloroflexi bacterium]|nr:NERD domain-containing protein [Chloroflexota bacterium]
MAQGSRSIFPGFSWKISSRRLRTGSSSPDGENDSRRARPRRSDSERRVFTLLREDQGTGAWTVLHSLGLSSAYSGAYGEIDFVAAVPGLGLICIEVKGGRVQCAQGLWTTTNRIGDTGAYARSPFQQARDGMFRLLHALRSRFGERSAEARCPLGWMVIFTDTTVPPPSPEFDRAELIVSSDLQSVLAARLAACPSLQRAAGASVHHLQSPGACRAVPET